MTKGTRVRWSDQHITSEALKVAPRNAEAFMRHLTSQRGVIVDSRAIGKRLVLDVIWDGPMRWTKYGELDILHTLPAELLTEVEP